MNVKHIVLLGDSIFDNGVYVPGEPPVIDQVRQHLTPTDTATLLAVDGEVTADVAQQLKALPNDATHLFVSVGGNDALGKQELLHAGGEALLFELTAVFAEFSAAYRAMLDGVLLHGKPTTVCTIYDAVPGLPPEAIMALSLFNDSILRAAFARGLPVLDLRLTCTEAKDYSSLSPIEPSAVGGAKIAGAIARVVQQHDFTKSRSSIYA